MRKCLLFCLLFLSTSLLGCGDDGNSVIESADDPNSMSLGPSSSEDMKESGEAMGEMMNPNKKYVD